MTQGILIELMLHNFSFVTLHNYILCEIETLLLQIVSIKWREQNVYYV